MALKLSKLTISGHFEDFFYSKICDISKSILSILDLFKVPKSIFFNYDIEMRCGVTKNALGIEIIFTKYVK